MQLVRWAILAAVVTLSGATPSTAAPPAPDWWRFLPKAEQNNVWYAQNDKSPTVFVFIHGVFSSSRSCWLYEPADKNPAGSAYWPQLLVTDPALQQPSIYLSGFHTQLDSGKYDMVQAAQELIDAIKADHVLEGRSQVIFVGHSTGGIMARYLLTHHSEQFVDKKIGLLLMASPSMGSKLANLGSIPARFLDQQMGRQLEWNSPFLVQLDRDFRALMHDKKTLHIEGREVLEHKFVIKSMFLPSRTVVVEEASGSRYFGPARIIPESDHHSLVKPKNAQDAVHKILVAFYEEHFSPFTKPSQQSLQAQLREAAREIEANPKDAFAYGKRGQAYSELEQLQNALDAYNTALKLYPEYFAAMHGRAIVYAKLKRFDEALADINTAQQLLPDHPGPYLMRAMFQQSAAEQETGRSKQETFHEGALADFALALERQPKAETMIRTLRARSLAALGRTEEAANKPAASKK